MPITNRTRAPTHLVCQEEARRAPVGDIIGILDCRSLEVDFYIVQAGGVEGRADSVVWVGKRDDGVGRAAGERGEDVWLQNGVSERVKERESNAHAIILSSSERLDVAGLDGPDVGQERLVKRRAHSVCERRGEDECGRQSESSEHGGGGLAASSREGESRMSIASAIL